MKACSLLTAAILGLILICGCAAPRKSNEEYAAILATGWQPWTNEVTTAEQLGSALAARWSLDRIRSYCEITPPTPGTVQNLVRSGDGEMWEDTLHKGEMCEFQRIYWYAIWNTPTEGDNSSRYSVCAKKGKEFWIIEIGNPQELQEPPSRTLFYCPYSPESEAWREWLRATKGSGWN